MKNIIFPTLLMGLAGVAFTACDDDNDSNPVLMQPAEGSFVLNAPSGSDTEVYDLANSDCIALTCAQPNYGGFPMELYYAVQLTTDTETLADLVTLPTGSTSTTVKVKAQEVNDAVYDIWTAANGEDAAKPSSLEQTVYLRLVAQAHNDKIADVYSNFVPVTVRASYLDPGVTLPAELYVCGTVTGTGDWSVWRKMVSINGMNGKFFTMIYAPEDGAKFKWGTYANEWLGYGDINAWGDGADGLVSADGDGNIVVGKAGWWVVLVECSVKGAAVNYTMSFSEGAMYVIGGCTGSWTDGDAAWRMTAPDNANGEWVSPAFTSGGEVRAYVKVGSFDWWRTEFTVMTDGTVFWRESADIASNWNENMGADYSCNASTGQSLHIVLDNGEGVGTGRLE